MTNQINHKRQKSLKMGTKVSNQREIMLGGYKYQLKDLTLNCSSYQQHQDGPSVNPGCLEQLQVPHCREHVSSQTIVCKCTCFLRSFNCVNEKGHGASHIFKVQIEVELTSQHTSYLMLCQVKTQSFSSILLSCTTFILTLFQFLYALIATKKYHSLGTPYIE